MRSIAELLPLAQQHFVLQAWQLAYLKQFDLLHAPWQTPLQPDVKDVQPKRHFWEQSHNILSAALEQPIFANHVLQLFEKIEICWHRVRAMCKLEQGQFVKSVTSMDICNFTSIYFLLALELRYETRRITLFQWSHYVIIASCASRCTHYICQVYTAPTCCILVPIGAKKKPSHFAAIGIGIPRHANS